MLGCCPLGDKNVVELVPGLGRTAKKTLAATPRFYMGVDSDAAAVTHVNEMVRPAGGSRRRGDIARTGLDDACSDAVIDKTMLTMQSPYGKAEIAVEVVRILRPSGICTIHGLGLAPDDIDPEIGSEISKALARSIHTNARSMTLVQWNELLIDHGLVAKWTSTAPMALLKLDRNTAGEGITRVLCMAKNLITRPGLRRRVMSTRRTFTKYEPSMRGVALATRKSL